MIYFDWKAMLYYATLRYAMYLETIVDEYIIDSIPHYGSSINRQKDSQIDR